MTLDLTKPAQTRSGLPVRVLCTDRKDDYAIVGLYPCHGQDAVDCWDSSGFCRNSGGNHPLDLVNVPPQATVTERTANMSVVHMPAEGGNFEKTIEVTRGGGDSIAIRTSFCIVNGSRSLPGMFGLSLSAARLLAEELVRLAP